MKKFLFISILVFAFFPANHASAATCPVIGGVQTVPAGIGVASDKCIDRSTGLLYTYGGQSTDLNSPGNTNSSAPTTAGGKLTYTPLEPLPGASPSTYACLSTYLNLVFKILLSIGAMIAVVTLVLGGITYMVSEIADKKSEARRRMQAALIGLFLLLTCWLILNEINPNLTKFTLPGIDNGCQVAAPTPTTQSTGGQFSGAGVTPTNTNSTQINTFMQNCNGAVRPDSNGGLTCSNT